jgi:outer membrane protein OmpA-like peptidoglycan-associated protein
VAESADRSRRPGWLPLVGAAVLVPTVLAGLTQLWPRPQIEQQLTTAGAQALASAGFPGAGLVLDGRDATISGIDPADSGRAIDTVQGVTGVRVATVPDTDVAIGDPTSAVPAPPAAPAGEAEPFGIARRGEDFVLSGVVGSQEEHDRMLAAATSRAGGRTVVDELTVTAGAILPTGVNPTSVEAAAGALAGGVGGDTAISISDGGVSLTGTVADDAAKNTAEQAVSAALPGIAVNNQLVVDPALAGAPSGTAAAPAAPGAAAGELDAAGKQQLQNALNQLLGGAPISFLPNSSALTPEGSSAVAQVLQLVRGAPGARLQIDGFVATGPGGGQFTAQQLSDQRAAAVRDALVAGGVPADRIVARGLGEGSAPAASAGGRRVDIIVI